MRTMEGKDIATYIEWFLRNRFEAWVTLPHYFAVAIESSYRVIIFLTLHNF